MSDDLRPIHPRQCTAHKSHGGPRCRAYAIKGSNVCSRHGGLAPQVRKAAENRLLALVEPALAELGKIIESKQTSDADKLKAVAEVLDRTGFGRHKFATQRVDVHRTDERPLSPERIAQALSAGEEHDSYVMQQRAIFEERRAARMLDNVVDAEVVAE